MNGIAVARTDGRARRRPAFGLIGLGALLCAGGTAWMVLLHHAAGAHERGEPPLPVHMLRDAATALPAVCPGRRARRRPDAPARSRAGAGQHDAGQTDPSKLLDAIHVTPAERMEFVVDFKRYAGQRRVLVNLLAEPSDRKLFPLKAFDVDRADVVDESEVPPVLRPDAGAGRPVAERARGRRPGAHAGPPLRVQQVQRHLLVDQRADLRPAPRGREARAEHDRALGPREPRRWLGTSHPHPPRALQHP